MSKATEHYTVEMIKCSELETDRRIQREGLNMVKVRSFVKNYNPGALGVLTVSHRANGAQILLDGMHRNEATRIVTDNQGELSCHVFRGLTLAEEAQMFLDLNATSQVPANDKFKVLLSGEGPLADAARDIQELVGAYGWKITNVPGQGNINCVKVVQRLYERSVTMDASPNLVHMATLAITRAWGTQRAGMQGACIEGIGRMFGEYGEKLDLDHLVNVMKHYQGGPIGLLAEASQLAAMKKSKVSMALADILVTSYNRGRRSKVLESWRFAS